jgi:hypothetical protein
MFIPDPDFCPSLILDLGSWIQKQIQKRGVKKNCRPTFFCGQKNHKYENYIFFELVMKKIWADLQRITAFCPKNCHQAGFGI